MIKPIAIGLDLLQGEKNVSSGNVLSSIVVIRNSLKSLKRNNLEGAGNQLVVALPLVDELLNGLEKRFGNFFNVENFQLPAVLYPQFKFNRLRKSEKDFKLRKQIISKV